MSGDIASRTRERVQSWNLHDPDSYAGFYAEDAVVYDPQYPEPLRGREAIRRDFESFVTTFPDSQFTLSRVLADDDTVAFELVANGTNKGPLPGPEGPIPATNRTMEMPVAAFSRLNEEGLITDERRYFDTGGLLQQLGLG